MMFSEALTWHVLATAEAGFREIDGRATTARVPNVANHGSTHGTADGHAEPGQGCLARREGGKGLITTWDMARSG